MAGMAADDAPETSPPPTPRGETESDDEESSFVDSLLNLGATNDAELITRVVVPPPPRDPRAMTAEDAYLMFLQEQERELSVHLRGQAARDYARGLSDGGSAAGEENQVSSPWRFVALSDLIRTQPPAPDQPAAAVAQADYSVAEAVPTAAVAQADYSVAEAVPAAAVAQADYSVAEAARSQICRSCRRWRPATPWAPYTHVCLCVTCRHNPSARTRCSVCGAGRRRSPTDSPYSRVKS